MSLLERETQVQELGSLLAAAAAGCGRVAAVFGEAGAGKTALVQAFTGQVASRARIFRSACEDLSIPDPLGPLYDLAREAQWTLSRESQKRQRLAIFSDALEVFESGAYPTVLLIEDLHWADEATLDLVRFLGRRIYNTHIVLLLTARNDGGDAQRRMRRALADIPADNIVRIEIPLLTEAAVLALGDANGQDGGAIYRATSGNAFFVTELLRAKGGQQPPPSVRDAILARAERLSVGARMALDAVSVFPRQAETAALQIVCGPDSAGDIAECVSCGMLDDLGDACAFRHEIARDAIELALSTLPRRELNARALAALRLDRNVPTARLVHHALEAHDLAAVRELAPIAAREASRLGAHREAAEHYEKALKQAERFELDERAALFERYAFECHLIGRLQHALDAEGKACQLRRRQGNKLKEGDCLRWLSRFSYILGDREAADEYGEQAIKILETGPPGAELAMAYSNQSQLEMLAGKVDTTRRYGEKAIALAEGFGRSDIVCHALNNIGTSEAWGDADKGRQLLDRSLEIALADDLQEHAARTFTNRSWVEVCLMDFHEAEAVLRSGIEYCVERDIDTWRDYMRGWLAELFLRQGRWDDAADVALEVVGNDDAAPLLRYTAVTVLARLQMRRGEESAEAFAELSRFLVKGMELQRLAAYAILMAERAWLGQGDREEALCLIERAERMATSRAVFGDLVFWRHVLAPTIDLGDTSGMADPYRMFFAGDWRAASAKWEKLGAPYDRALALLWGDEGAQREALAIFQALGAKSVAQHVRNIMRRSGITHIARGPHRKTRANRAGLTEREVEVLHLIDRGFSNKRIAAQLYISPKTVDHHVTALLGKLDAASRGEASALAREAGLI